MPELRDRLYARLRRAERQRLMLRSRADDARAAFSPPALKQRAKDNVVREVKAADRAARETINTYRIPLIAAALGGLAIALQGPARRYGPDIIRRLKALAEGRGAESEPVDVETMDEIGEGARDGQAD